MKSKVQHLPYTLDLNLCSDFFFRRDYCVQESNETELLMFKPGTSFTSSIKRIALDLSIRLGDGQTEISLSYGTWVLFDTGDLKEEILKIASQIEKHKHDLGVTNDRQKAISF